MEQSKKTREIEKLSPAAGAFNRIVELMEILRSENGCPWDKEQTPETLRSTFIEETFEAIDAITENDGLHVKEELGDVFFNLVFIARCYEEQGIFDAASSINDVCDKLVRRHPHVFGEMSEGIDEMKKSRLDSAETVSQWDRIKDNVEGRKQESVIDSVPKGFPPLLKAYKMVKKAAKAGFTWKTAEEAESKVLEEIEEIRLASKENDADHLEEEMGDFLLAAVNFSRMHGIDPNVALERAVGKFERRFKHVETEVKNSGRSMKDVDVREMMEIWNMAKSR